jgi:hypothetical protein
MMGLVLNAVGQQALPLQVLTLMLGELMGRWLAVRQGTSLGMKGEGPVQVEECLGALLLLKESVLVVEDAGFCWKFCHGVVTLRTVPWALHHACVMCFLIWRICCCICWFIRRIILINEWNYDGGLREIGYGLIDRRNEQLTQTAELRFFRWWRGWGRQGENRAC